MNKLLTLDFLKGHRTQIVVFIQAALTFALNMNWLTVEQYTQVVGFLTAIGLLTAAAHKPKE